MPDAPKNHGSRKFLNADNLYPCASVTSCRLRSSWKWVRSWYLCPVKKLRTFPNILIANLALADLMNTLVNIPIYVLWGVLNVKWFSGKTLAIISLFLSHLFILVNVVCMLVLLVNVFLAIALDLKYFTWKTNKKALAIDLAVWLVCLNCTGLLSWSISDIDLQDASVFKYRRSFVTEAKSISSAIGATFVVTAVVFGVLAFCSIKRKVRKVSGRVFIKL